MQANPSLVALMREKLNDDEYNMYLELVELSSPTCKFSINLNAVFEWMGYNKRTAKRVLFKNFKYDEDYVIALKHFPIITYKTFRKMCTHPSSKNADKFIDFYIRIEEILFGFLTNRV
jgi:hypothetical protein